MNQFLEEAQMIIKEQNMIIQQNISVPPVQLFNFNEEIEAENEMKEQDAQLNGIVLWLLFISLDNEHSFFN